VSDYTYEGIRNRMVAESGPLRAQELRSRRQAEHLAVFGTIYTSTDRIELDAFYRVPDAWDVFGRDPLGEYSIRLLNDVEGVLADYAFTPRFNHVDPGPSCESAAMQEEEPALITEYVPWVDGAAFVTIYHGAQELARRPVSGSAPAVTLLHPNGGEVLDGNEVSVVWDATDVDGDPLEFTLEYSVDDGARWSPLGSRITTTEIILSAALVPGTDQGKFRIVASDGVNGAQDESDNTFTVPNKAPDVQIVSPSDGATYLPGQSVPLIGNTLDVEDGTLDDELLLWTSSVRGTVGTGQMLHVTDFITGTHIITLTATDSGGQQGSAAVTIKVSGAEKHIYLPLVLSD
jgi:hypothetical protein